MVYVLTTTQRKEQMEEFLDAFLTKTEKVMLAKRLAVVFLLSEGVGETQIADTLAVTQPTVSRIKLWYETKGSGYKIAIDKFRKEQLLKELKIITLKLASKAIRAAGGRP